MSNNIVCIPYHDWRKIEKEGFRTRDSHLIENFSKLDSVEKVLVINRPTTFTEIAYNKYKVKLKGKIILKDGKCTLYKVNEKVFVLDFITNDLISPILKKRLWAFRGFNFDKLHDFYLKSIKELQMESSFILSNNLFSVTFLKKIKNQKIIFDGYDNLLQIPFNQKIFNQLFEGYKSFVDIAPLWITNSTKNIEYYSNRINAKSIHLIKNGVDVERFLEKFPIPNDLKSIKKPIIGFGGKITHLFDYELLNFCAKKHPDKSFVIVGQILDSEVFSKIEKLPNIHYLGDKTYNEYVKYVTNFDLGIVPYVEEKNAHGIDSIKKYEYIAAGINVVITFDSDIETFNNCVFLSHDKEDFSNKIDLAINSKNTNPNLEKYSWRNICLSILELFNQI